MMSSNEGTLFTYALAYSIIVGIAPFIIIAVVFVGTYVYEVTQIIDLLQRFIPSDLILPFVEYVQASDLSNLWLIVSLLGVSIWVASKSIYSFLLLSSDQEGVEINHFILRILSCVYFILIVLSIVGIGIVIGYVPFINRFTTPFLLIPFFMFFYRLLSFRHTQFKDVFWGSLITSFVMLALGRLFFFYINEFSNYQTIYGPFASMMILLISCWLISWVVFFGYCINYVFRDDVPSEHNKPRLTSFLERSKSKEEEFIAKQKEHITDKLIEKRTDHDVPVEADKQQPQD